MWLRDLSCLRGAVYCLISKPCVEIHLYLPVIAEENAQKTTPIFVYVSFYKNILKKGRVQCIFANFIA